MRKGNDLLKMHQNAKWMVKTSISQRGTMARRVAAGLPLIGFCVFGWLWLSHVMAGKREVEKASEDKLSREASRRERKKRQIDLDQERERLAPQSDYENKPVPGKPAL